MALKAELSRQMRGCLDPPRSPPRRAWRKWRSSGGRLRLLRRRRHSWFQPSGVDEICKRRPGADGFRRASGARQRLDLVCRKQAARWRQAVELTAAGIRRARINISGVPGDRPGTASRWAENPPVIFHLERGENGFEQAETNELELPEQKAGGFLSEDRRSCGRMRRYRRRQASHSWAARRLRLRLRRPRDGTAANRSRATRIVS